jgi:hypothetical protein
MLTSGMIHACAPIVGVKKIFWAENEYGVQHVAGYSYRLKTQSLAEGFM